MKKIFGLLKKGVRKIMELTNEVINAKAELVIKKLEIVEHIADKSIDIAIDSVRGTVGLAGDTCKVIKRNPVIFMGIGVGIVIVGGSILLQNKMLNVAL